MRFSTNRQELLGGGKRQWDVSGERFGLRAEIQDGSVAGREIFFPSRIPVALTSVLQMSL